MITNQIIKLNLEPRIAALKTAGKTEREIASILSQEVNQKVSRSAIHRYLAGNVKIAQQAVEANSKLKVKVAEMELNTVEERHRVIDKVKNLADQAESVGDTRTALYALRIAISALDSLDERLGDISRAPQVNVDVGIQFNQEVMELKALYIGELCPGCKRKVHNRLQEVAEASGGRSECHD